MEYFSIKSGTMTILINKETWDILQKIAKSRKLTDSDIVREAIYQFLEKQLQDSEAKYRRN